MAKPDFVMIMPGSTIFSFKSSLMAHGGLDSGMTTSQLLEAQAATDKTSAGVAERINEHIEKRVAKGAVWEIVPITRAQYSHGIERFPIPRLHNSGSAKSEKIPSALLPFRSCTERGRTLSAISSNHCKWT